MSTITDKLRSIDYKNKAPITKASLKDTILDFKADPKKEFNDNKPNVLDKDFNEKGVKRVQFKPDNNVKLVEDTGTKQMKRANFNNDPFRVFFGFESREVPNRKLDGYYEYNLEGKDNIDFMKDNLLREGGNVTDLEARLTAKEEFLELYRLKGEKLKEVEPKIKENIDIELGKVEKAERRKLPEETKIEVERAVREGSKKELSDYIEKEHQHAVKPPKNAIKALEKLSDLNLAEADQRNAIWRRAVNNVFKKYKLPQITTVMDATKISELIKKNSDIINYKALEEIGDKHYKDRGSRNGKLKGARDAIRLLKANADEARTARHKGVRRGSTEFEYDDTFGEADSFKGSRSRSSSRSSSKSSKHQPELNYDDSAFYSSPLTKTTPTPSPKPNPPARPSFQSSTAKSIFAEIQSRGAKASPTPSPKPKPPAEKAVKLPEPEEAKAKEEERGRGRERGGENPKKERSRSRSSVREVEEMFASVPERSLTISELENVAKTIAPIFEGKETSKSKISKEDLDILKKYSYALGKTPSGHSTYNSMYETFVSLEHSINVKKTITPKEQIKIGRTPVKKAEESK
jgi:hypothetical protein